MHVWAESIGDGLDTELQMLKNNGEIPWRFDDWRVMREVNSYCCRFVLKSSDMLNNHICP